MDFALSPRAAELQQRLLAFMDECVYPAEPTFSAAMRDSGDPHFHPPVMEELKAEARERGLWNLFLPRVTEWTPEPVSNTDYAPLAEITGRSPLGPEAVNCGGARHGQHGDPVHVRHTRAAGTSGSCRSWPARSDPASP